MNTTLILALALTPTAKQLPPVPDYDVKALNEHVSTLVRVNPKIVGDQSADLAKQLEQDFPVSAVLNYDELYILKRRPLSGAEWERIRSLKPVTGIEANVWPRVRH